MANPAEQFIPPGVDTDKVDEIKRNRPTLRVIEGGKGEENVERWSPKEFVDQEKWTPEEISGRAKPAENAEEFLKQKEADEKQLEALQKAIDELAEGEKTSNKAFPGERYSREPQMDTVKKVEQVGLLPPEPPMELSEEDIEEDLTPTNRIPELANKPAIDYGDLQPGMEDLPELSSEFLKEDDSEQPTLVKEEGQLPRYKTDSDLDKAA